MNQEMEMEMTNDTTDLDKLRARGMQEASALFEGNQRATERWLASPVRGLGGKTPNELMESAKGIQQVRTLIGQLEHGVIH